MVSPLAVQFWSACQGSVITSQGGTLGGLSRVVRMLTHRPGLTSAFYAWSAGVELPALVLDP
jgi:hypothetical protein